MNHAGFRAALVRRDLPLISRSRHQHRARLRTQFPVLMERMRNRAGAAHQLNAVQGILVNVRGRSQLGDDLGPVGVHFVGQNHRQRGVHTLAELQPVHRDQDPAIRLDLDEGVGRISLRLDLGAFLRG